MKSRSRKRTLLMVLLLLTYSAGGTIINVAVAWGCAIRNEFQRSPFENSPPEEFRATWARLAEPNWIAEPVRGRHRRIFATRELGADAGQWENVQPDGKPMTFPRYLTSELCVGWPLLGLRRTHLLDNEHPGWIVRGQLKLPFDLRSWGGRTDVRLPIQPLWPGFAINTIFYAAILWLPFAAPGFVRRRMRRARGQCTGCGYPIGTNPLCTECGRPVRADGTRELEAARKSPWPAME